MKGWVDGWMKISFDRLSGGECVDKNGECLTVRCKNVWKDKWMF